MGGQRADELKDIFNLIDEDGGGSISFDEVKHFGSCLSNPPADSKIEELIDLVSKGEGEVDPLQFVQLCDELQKITGVQTDQHVALFKKMCYRELFVQLEGGDGSGDVTKSDLIKLFTAMEIHGATDEDIRKVFLKYDEDGSGRIEIDEFVGIVGEIAGSMPLSHCVRRFTTARVQSQQRMASMRAAFGRTKGPRSPAAPPARAAPKPAPRVEQTPASTMRGGATPVSPVPCFSCANLRTELGDAHMQLANLRSQLDEATSSLRALEAEKEGFLMAQSTSVNLEGELAKARSAAEAADAQKAKIEQLERSVHDLEDRLKKKGGADAAQDAKKLRKLQQDLDDSQRKAKVLEGKLEHLTKHARAAEQRAVSKAAMQMSQQIQQWEKKVQDRDSQIAQLQAALEHAGAGGHVNEDFVADMQAELADRDHQIVTLQHQVEELQTREGGDTHVWTLERALEIRSAEIGRLHDALMSFAQQVEAKDKQLAEAMRGEVHESQLTMQQAEANPQLSSDDSAALRAEIADLQSRLAAGGGVGSDADAQLLQVQVWTLEQALEIRARENENLHHMMVQFANQVRELDAELAEMMHKALRDTNQQRVQEEKDAMGGKTADDAIQELKEKKKKKGKKQKKDKQADAEEEVVGMQELAEREIDRLKALLAKREGQLQQHQQIARQRYMDWAGAAALGFTGGPGSGGGGGAPQPGHPGYDEYQAYIAQHGYPGSGVGTGGTGGAEFVSPEGRPLRSLGDFQEEVRRLRKQLEAAQKAIIAGTQYGWQRDLKLGEARRALTRMLETHGEWLCVGRSPSPSRTRQLPSHALASSLSPPGGQSSLSPKDTTTRGLPKAWMSWRDRAVAASAQRPTAHVWQSPPRPSGGQPSTSVPGSHLGFGEHCSAGLGQMAALSRLPRGGAG